MYLTFLILSLGVLLFLEYYIFFDKKIATPAISFTLGLFVCAVILSSFINIWDVHIHEETYRLIIGGNICVILGSLLGNVLSKKKILGKWEREQFILISVTRLKTILFVQILMATIRVFFSLQILWGWKFSRKFSCPYNGNKIWR